MCLLCEPHCASESGLFSASLSHYPWPHGRGMACRFSRRGMNKNIVELKIARAMDAFRGVLKFVPTTSGTDGCWIGDWQAGRRSVRDRIRKREGIDSCGGEGGRVGSGDGSNGGTCHMNTNGFWCCRHGRMAVACTRDNSNPLFEYNWIDSLCFVFVWKYFCYKDLQDTD